MQYKLLPVHISHHHNSPKAYATSIICKGESLVKARKFYSVPGDKNN